MNKPHSICFSAIDGHIWVSCLYIHFCTYFVYTLLVVSELWAGCTDCQHYPYIHWVFWAIVFDSYQGALGPSLGSLEKGLKLKLPWAPLPGLLPGILTEASRHLLSTQD